MQDRGGGGGGGGGEYLVYTCPRSASFGGMPTAKIGSTRGNNFWHNVHKLCRSSPANQVPSNIACNCTSLRGMKCKPVFAGRREFKSCPVWNTFSVILAAGRKNQGFVTIVRQYMTTRQPQGMFSGVSGRYAICIREIKPACACNTGRGKTIGVRNLSTESTVISDSDASKRVIRAG